MKADYRIRFYALYEKQIFEKRKKYPNYCIKNYKKQKTYVLLEYPSPRSNYFVANYGYNLSKFIWLILKL